jgi:hypothetical protein
MERGKTFSYNAHVVSYMCTTHLGGCTLTSSAARQAYFPSEVSVSTERTVWVSGPDLIFASTISRQSAKISG